MYELRANLGRTVAAVFVLGGTVLWAADSMATPDISLFDYGINIDGTTTCPVVDGCNVGSSVFSVSGVNDGGFNYSTGLGSLSLSLSGAGTHDVNLFLDHDIDAAINTFYNENGQVVGTHATGQSYEIDEPGFIFGDIFDKFLAGALDNTNSLPPGLEDDVSMALGWDFSLASGETANIMYSVSTTTPGGGFYLKQYDPDSNASLYFSSSLSIRSLVPEPSTVLLLAMGLAMIRLRARVQPLRASGNAM